MIEKNVVPLRYSCQLRINAGDDEELLDLLHRTRCKIAYVGIESVNPLIYYKKGQTIEKIIKSIDRFRKYGIGIHGMFVLGSNADTQNTISETVNFAIESGLDTIQICALTPFPGTEVYNEMVKTGRLLHQRWELYDGLHVVIMPKNMTPYELQMGIIEQMRWFYSVKNLF